MPRVLRIINRFNLGGPTFNAANLSRFLPPQYHTMLVGGLKEPHEESSEFIVLNMGVTPVVINEMRRSINPFQDIVAFFKLRSIIREFKPDIVHTHAAKAGTLGRLAAWSCGVPVIVHTFHGHVFHSYFGSFKTRVFKSIERFLARRSSSIIAISDIQKTEICDHHAIVSRDKCTVIPLGFDLTKFQTNNEQKRIKFRQQYALNDDEIAIVIVGRVVPVKNHELFVDAFSLMLQQTKLKVRAFIVGDGDNRPAIEQRAKILGLQFTTPASALHDKPLCFTSWIKDVDEVYSGADIVALTSYNEGTPVSLIEAHAAAKPIITTNVGGIEDIVTDDVTGLLVENCNVDQFADKLLKLVEDADLRQRLSTRGRKFVNQKYHYTRLVNDMDALYQRLLEK